MTSYGLTFDAVESPRQQRQLRDFLFHNVGPYNPEPHYSWIEDKNMPEIESGVRRALAWWQQGEMIGDAVLKVVPYGSVYADSPSVDLKHTRMNKFVRRGGARFMMEQVFHETPEMLAEQGLIPGDANEVELLLDTPADGPAVSFFRHFGFEVYDAVPLYYPDRLEALMRKAIPLG